MTSTARETCVSPRSLALSCVGFIASASGAHAQAAPNESQPTQLKGVTVKATAIDEPSYKAEPADNPKLNVPLINTPRSIVVVPEQVIKETGSATLAEALRTVPGITFGAAEGGNPIGDRPFIRGFDSQGSTYLDGVRDIGAQTREIFAVDQIQIVRGSDSSLGGRGSAGGTINIISKLPTTETFASGAVSYGTDDYKRVTADVNYKIAENVAFRIQGMWHDQDVAGRDAIFQKRWGVAPSFTVGVGTDTRLTASYYHLHQNELPDSGIPYTYVCTATLCNAPTGESYSEPAHHVTTVGGQTGTVSYDTFYGLKDRDFRKANTDQPTLRAEHDFGGITLRNTARYSHTYQAYIYLLPDDSTGNVVGNPANPIAQPGGQVWRRANTRYGTTDSIINQTDLYGEFHTGSVKHVFSGGLEISWEDADRGIFVARGQGALATGSTITPRCNAATIARYYCTSLFDPDPNDPWQSYATDTSNTLADVVKSPPITQTLNRSRTRAAYLFDSITLVPSLILNLGARVDEFKSRVSPGLAFNATTDRFWLSRKDTIFNWQAGLVFKPTPDSSLYASYATSATPPNSLLGEGQEQNALGTTNTSSALGILDSLKVERTKSYEVGGKANFFGDALAVNVALFRTETRNARVSIDANTVAFVGERRINGAELGINGNITAEWSVFGGYSYLDAKITDAGLQSLAVPAAFGRAATTTYVESSSNGRQFPQTAKHSVTLWTDYKVTPALTLGGGAFYMSRVFGGYSDNRTATQNAAGVITVNPATSFISRSVPGYWRFDARIGYQLTDAINLSVNVQNLTDKRYFSQAYTSHYATVAPGRSAFATISAKY